MTITSGASSEPWTASTAAAAAKAEGVRFQGVWLEVAPEGARGRIRQRAQTGRDASDADERVLDQQLRRPIEGLTWERIEAVGDVNSVSAECIARL